MLSHYHSDYINVLHYWKNGPNVCLLHLRSSALTAFVGGASSFNLYVWASGLVLEHLWHRSSVILLPFSWSTRLRCPPLPGLVHVAAEHPRLSPSPQWLSAILLLFSAVPHKLTAILLQHLITLYRPHDVYMNISRTRTCSRGFRKLTVK